MVDPQQTFEARGNGVAPSRARERLRFRAFRGVLRAAEAIGGVEELDADALEAEARRTTQLENFGDPYYRHGLARLIESANGDADLNAYGRLLMRRVVLVYLQSRLRFVHQRQTQPERFQTRLLPPLIVMGLPRTGTTHLHRLLASDPAHRSVPYWELVTPLPRSQRDSPARRRRAAQEALLPRQWFTPELDAVHYIRPDTPEECMFMLGFTFESLVFWVLAPVYGYLEWYMEQDRVKKYQEYAWMLHALQTVAPERRLVLKAPAHTDALEALLEAVPNALIVQTHRDMVQTTSSWCSTNLATQSVATRSVDVRKAAQTNAGLLEATIERNARARQRFPDRVFDVRYEDLVASPERTIDRIYSHFGIEMTAAYRKSAQRYLAQNQKGKHGTHDYAPSDFGLRPEDLRRRFRGYEREYVSDEST